MASIGTMIGVPLIFGGAEPLPLKGWPEGRVKIRMRPDDFVTGTVRSPDGTTIRTFHVTERDGYWVPSDEIAANVSLESTGEQFKFEREPVRRSLEL